MKFEDFEISTRLDARSEGDTDKEGLLLKAYSNDPSEVWRLFIHKKEGEEPVDFLFRAMDGMERLLRRRLNPDGTFTEYGEERFFTVGGGEHGEDS